MKDEQKGKPNESDRYLPVANISRIIKNNLPNEIKLSKDAKEAFQECVSEFISFITSEASERCNNDRRKTVNGDDILNSMASLGFDRYVPILKIYLEKYRESQKIVPNEGTKEVKNDEENIMMHINNDNK